MSQQSSWPFIASILYTTAWCVSFYGQIYQNYKLKSVQGFCLDYLVLNFTGYFLYTIYSSFGYFTNIKGAGTVQIADLIFVYHSVLMISIQLFQCWIYQKGNNKITKQAGFIVITIWLIVSLEAILTRIGLIQWTQYWNPLSALGYGKLVITLVKYTPPAYYNYKRKSTKGWSIFNILLDLVGAAFSMASGGLSVSNGLNVTKVVLAFITLAFDLLFCFQHYVLYRKPSVKTQKNSVESALLSQQISK